MRPFVSILMLVYNAPLYTEIAIRSLRRRTVGVDYELVVVDNASDRPTRELLERLVAEGLIDTIKFSDRNTFFAEGNNIAAELADPRATHFLLLNSDVKIKSRRWLTALLGQHQRGVTSYGIAPDPLRADGYCLLIDADLYRSHPLDQSHQWFWGVTKLQAALLREGYPVRARARHRRFLHHYGGRSGSAFEHARGRDVSRAEVAAWFAGREAEVIDLRRDGSVPGRRNPKKPPRWQRLALRVLGPAVHRFRQLSLVAARR